MSVRIVPNSIFYMSHPLRFPANILKKSYISPRIQPLSLIILLILGFRLDVDEICALLGLLRCIARRRIITQKTADFNNFIVLKE
jgi:hypothetical protein